MIWWQGPTDGVTDCTPYLNTIIACIPSTGDTVLEIPSGQFSFYSPPSPIPRMTIRGQGKLATIFNKHFDNSAMFFLDGKKGDGAIIESLACLSYKANAPGYFVYMAGDSSHQPDCTIIRDCWVSSNDGGTWYTNIVLDGTARKSPQGLRMVLIEDCELFNAETFSITAANCVGLKVRGVGLFVGTGKTCGIYVDPASTKCFFTDIVNNGPPITRNPTCSYTGILE